MRDLGKPAWDIGPVGEVRTTVPFIGRRQQLDWFAQHLADAMAGRPQVILIRGEAGIGKTRLVREFADRVGDEA